MKILLIAQGNPGRTDDGIGLKLVELIRASEISNLETIFDYQLNIEHASDMQDADMVIFADSSVNCNEPFEFRTLEPAGQFKFSTHSLSPESVLFICNDLYKRNPECFILAVRGYNYDLGNEISGKALLNTLRATVFILCFIIENIRRKHTE